MTTYRVFVDDVLVHEGTGGVRANAAYVDALITYADYRTVLLKAGDHVARRRDPKGPRRPGGKPRGVIPSESPFSILNSFRRA